MKELPLMVALFLCMLFVRADKKQDLYPEAETSQHQEMHKRQTERYVMELHYAS